MNSYMLMWIYFNLGINQIKPPVLVTYLRAMWKLTEQNSDDLPRWELVEGQQKLENLSKHLTKCKLAGLLSRTENRHKVSESDYISDPSFTVIRNPSHKVWIEKYEDINEVTAFFIQLTMGKEFSNYMLNKHEAITKPDLTIHPISANDYLENNFQLDLEWNGMFYYLFTLYNPKYKAKTMIDQVHKLFKEGDIITIQELNMTLQSLYDKYKIKKTAKSTDLLLFDFETKRATIMKDGKRCEGIKIVADRRLHPIDE